MSYIYLNCENSTCSPGQGEESSAASFADIPVSVLSRLNPIAGKRCCNASETACCHASPSGMTSPHSTGSRGEEGSKSCAVDFPVRTPVSPGRGPGSTASAQDSGERWHGSLARYDPVSRSWRTRQRSLLGGLVEFSETWPKWGMTLDGDAYPQQMPYGVMAHRQWITSERDSGSSERMPTAYGFSKDGKSNGPSGNELGRAVNLSLRLPTPCASEARQGFQNRQNGKKGSQESLSTVIQGAPAVQAGGSLNPDWVEWLMGWPIGWTSLEPLPPQALADWQHHPGWWLTEPDVPRIAVGVTDRVNRLKAIGNGQVPAVAMLAWTFLMERLTGR